MLEAMEDIGRDWESSSDAASPSPSIGSQASVMGSNGTKKAINRGRWTKDEVRPNFRFRLRKGVN